MPGMVVSQRGRAFRCDGRGRLAQFEAFRGSNLRPLGTIASRIQLETAAARRSLAEEIGAAAGRANRGDHAVFCQELIFVQLLLERQIGRILAGGWSGKQRSLDQLASAGALRRLIPPGAFRGSTILSCRTRLSNFGVGDDGVCSRFVLRTEQWWEQSSLSLFGALLVLRPLTCPKRLDQWSRTNRSANDDSIELDLELLRGVDGVPLWTVEEHAVICGSTEALFMLVALRRRIRTRALHKPSAFRLKVTSGVQK